MPLILWTRRITGYKRLDILTETIKHPRLQKRFLAANVTILLGGRIHQQDGLSKLMMFTLLDFLAERPEMEKRIAIVDNYNVWEAPLLFHGVDATIMMSDLGKEASATGFMKAQVNGGLVLATADGAIPESVIFYGKEADGRQPNGFEIKYINGSPTPESFLDAIEAFSNIYNDKKKHGQMIRAAIDMLPQVNVERTIRETMDLINSLYTESPVAAVP
jgi:glucan phosphorylase